MSHLKNVKYVFDFNLMIQQCRVEPILDIAIYIYIYIHCFTHAF